LSAGFWVESTNTFEDGPGTSYLTHRDGVFTFHAISSDRPDYFVWFDRIDSKNGREYGYFASLQEAEAYITARRGNYYGPLANVTVL
jgi:hypothetical protein